MMHLNAAVRRSVLLAWIAPVMQASCAITVRATTLMRMSIAQMAQRAPLIVRARCLANSVGWDAGEIWTRTNFEVVEVWRGASSGRIVVRLLGGSAGNLTSSVSGVPRFRPGEEVILFLEPTPRGDYSILSWEQGTFRIGRNPATNEETVTQDTSSFATFDARARRFELHGTRNLPVDSLRKQIESALRDRPSTRP